MTDAHHQVFSTTLWVAALSLHDEGGSCQPLLFLDIHHRLDSRSVLAVLFRSEPACDLFAVTWSRDLSGFDM